MENTTDWIAYRDELCRPIESDILGFKVQDKQRLISAIISNAFLNEQVKFEQLKKIPADKSLETIGDFVLDFVIIDHFARNVLYTAQQIDDFRQWYGNNINLQYFSKNCIHLQNFILWGPDEEKQRKFEQEI